MLVFAQRTYLVPIYNINDLITVTMLQVFVTLKISSLYISHPSLPVAVWFSGNVIGCIDEITLR